VAKDAPAAWVVGGEAGASQVAFRGVSKLTAGVSAG
jgi:hypothetical protein